MIKGKLSSDALSKLLDKLGSDDDFRARLQANPKAALAEHGLEVDTSKLPAKITLPSKETVLATKSEMQDRIPSDLGLIMFIFISK